VYGYGDRRDSAVSAIPPATAISVPGRAGRSEACHRVLLRRSIRTGELAFYRCNAPADVPLATLVSVAGRRWTVEESFQAGKGLASLDERQVRRWTSWRRWTIIAMLAHAFLAVMAARVPLVVRNGLDPWGSWGVVRPPALVLVLVEAV
jgi:hypothetical protein